MDNISQNHLTFRLDRSSSSVVKPDPDFITVKDWAARLQVSTRTIFRMIDERVIPPCDFSTGKTRRWHRSTYENWAAEQTEKN